MKAVVTGGAGFIGSHLTDLLLEHGVDVIVLDNLADGDAKRVPAKARLAVLDIASPECREFVIREQPDYVFHLAAQVHVRRSIEDPVRDAQVNILGTLNLLEACRHARVQKFIYASSSAVYGETENLLIGEHDEIQPISFYGISKFAPELYIRQYHAFFDVPYTILRFANVYGPRQNPHGEGGVISILLHRLRSGLPFRVNGDGEQERDFIYVGDVASACWAAARRGSGADLFQVGTSVATSINALIQRVEELHGSPISLVHGPALSGDIRFSCLDNRQIALALGWKPMHSLAEGLQITYRDAMSPLNQP